jgi:hypothetical protein
MSWRSPLCEPGQWLRWSTSANGWTHVAVVQEIEKGAQQVSAYGEFETMIRERRCFSIVAKEQHGAADEPSGLNQSALRAFRRSRSDLASPQIRNQLVGHCCLQAHALGPTRDLTDALLKTVQGFGRYHVLLTGCSCLLCSLVCRWKANSEVCSPNCSAFCVLMGSSISATCC